MLVALGHTAESVMRWLRRATRVSDVVKFAHTLRLKPRGYLQRNQHLQIDSSSPQLGSLSLCCRLMDRIGVPQNDMR